MTDKTETLDSFLTIARRALKSGNLEEAVAYANKALEMDTDNAKAMLYKGIAKLLQSGKGNLWQIVRNIRNKKGPYNIGQNGFRTNTSTQPTARS